jgi:hypothetical protein
VRAALAVALLALLSGCRAPYVAGPAEAKQNHDIDWHVESEPAEKPPLERTP